MRGGAQSRRDDGVGPAREGNSSRHRLHASPAVRKILSGTAARMLLKASEAEMEAEASLVWEGAAPQQSPSLVAASIWGTSLPFPFPLWLRLRRVGGTVIWDEKRKVWEFSKHQEER